VTPDSRYQAWRASPEGVAAGDALAAALDAYEARHACAASDAWLARAAYRAAADKWLAERKEEA